jgi:hypothetical protein
MDLQFSREIYSLGKFISNIGKQMREELNKKACLYGAIIFGFK